MEKQEDTTEKRGFEKLGAIKIIVAIITTLVLLACFGHVVYHVCFCQHAAAGDAAFMQKVWEATELLSDGTSLKSSVKQLDYNAWASIIAYVSLKTGLHPLELCHRILPGILVTFMLLEYLYLGYRIFVMEKKGRYFTYMGMVTFAAVFFFLQYVIRFINVEPSLSIYINIWRENVIANLIILPLILATFLRVVYSHICKVKNDSTETEELHEDKEKTSKGRGSLHGTRAFSWLRDIIILSVELVLCVVIFSGQHLYQAFAVDKIGVKYIISNLWETNWPFFMALGCIVIVFMLKMKGALPVVMICILAALAGMPLPLAVVIAFGVSALIINPESIDLWQPVSFLIFGICVYVLAIETGSAAHFTATFERAENDYRIPDETVKMADYILENSSADPDSKLAVVTDRTMAYSIMQYTPLVDAVVIDEENAVNTTFIFDVGLDSGDYVIIKSDIEPSEALLINDEYAFDSKVGDYTVYRRTYWEETNGAWAHKGPYGFYLKDGWYKIDNELYYMNADGEVQTGWLKYDGETYYLKEDGKMAMNWEEIDDKWYFFGQDGAMRHDVTEAGYTLGPDGAMLEE